jgi:uncharacterized protein involved in exopolysaccharide biosynthesis
MTSTSILQTLRRRWLVLVVPIILCALVASAVAALQPREYSVSSTVWVDTPVPEAPTAGSASTTLSPAAGQLTLLTQLLTTREFVGAVAEQSPYAEDYRSADPLGRLRLTSQIAGMISASTPGPQLLAISTTGDEPERAVALAQAVLQQFQAAQAQIVSTRAKAQMEFDRQQLEAAQRSLAAASSQPGSASLEVAQAQVLEATAAYSASSQLANALSASDLRVVDEPVVAVPSARMKKTVVGGLAGVLAGFTLSALLLLWFLVNDPKRRIASKAHDEEVRDLPASEHFRQGLPESVR